MTRMGWRWMWAATATAMVLTVAGAVWAQTPAPKPEDVAGTWEGVSKGTNGEIPLKAELKHADGRFSGVISAGTFAVVITGGSLNGDTLTLSVDVDGAAGTLSGKVTGDRIEGSWLVGGESGALTLTRAAVAAAAATDPLSGEWNGEAAVQGQPMPITLILKLDGETVTGEIMSPMGRVPFTSASWKDGVLTMAFPYAGGEPITMGGKIVEGKLVGVFDYNGGEMQGTWSAVRK